MGTALLRLKEAKQREGQSVREFANFVEELEEDIPEMDPEVQRGWTLLNGLRPDLRRAVLRENKTISSRSQVLSAAQRQQELLQEGIAPEGPVGLQGDSPAKSGGDAGGEPAGIRKCFRCGKTGHLRKDCPEPKSGNVSGAAVKSS
jgi:hypothetical protein